MTLRYDIDSSGKRPYSIITTRAADGLSTSDISARESAAFVDGLGRAFVVLEQADPTAEDGGSYIATGLTDYDQKGNPKRQFLPWFTNQSPSSFSLASPPPTASKATVFDAFGRTIRTVDFDGVVELETHYHALSTDIWDRADLSSAQHRGTYQTVVHDGHGRTRIATDPAARRQRNSGLSDGDLVPCDRRIPHGATVLVAPKIASLRRQNAPRGARCRCCRPQFFSCGTLSIVADRLQHLVRVR